MLQELPSGQQFFSMVPGSFPPLTTSPTKKVDLMTGTGKRLRCQETGENRVVTTMAMPGIDYTSRQLPFLVKNTGICGLRGLWMRERCGLTELN